MEEDNTQQQLSDITQLQQPEQQQQSQPKFNFNQIFKCKKHRNIANFVCINPDTVQDMLLCSHCMLTHYKNYTPTEECNVLEDFISQLEKNCMNSAHKESEDNQRILEQLEIANQDYKSHLEQQKLQIEGFYSELIAVYQNQCEVLIKQLQSIMDLEQSKFDNLSAKLKSLNSKNNPVSMPTLDQIYKTLSQEDTDVDLYLRNLIRKQQSIQNASDTITNLIKNQQIHYLEQISSISNKKPIFQKDNKILSIWKQGLDSIITDVMSQSKESAFTNLSVIQPFNMELTSAEDLYLLTNDLIDHSLTIKLSEQLQPEKQELFVNRLQQFSQQLTKITIELSNWSTESIVNFVQQLQLPSEIEEFTFITNHSQINKSIIQQLAKLTGTTSKLNKLELGFNNANLNSQSYKYIGEIFRPQLRSLTLSLKHNELQAESVEQISERLAEMTDLEFLSLNLNGFSQKQNNLEAATIKPLFESFFMLTKLKELTVELGWTSLNYKGTTYLSKTIQNLTKLECLNLSLYNTNQNEESVKRLVKSIKSLEELKKLKLNLNNNPKIGGCEDYKEVEKLGEILVINIGKKEQ